MKLYVGFSTRKKKLIGNILIEKVEGTPYSHVFLLKDGVVFQAGWPSGVGTVGIEEFKSHHNILELLEYDLSPEQSLLYDGFVKGCEGKLYSEVQILAIALAKYANVKFEKLNGTKKYICSELCADALNFLLGFKFKKQHDFITPLDLNQELKLRK